MRAYLHGNRYPSESLVALFVMLLASWAGFAPWAHADPTFGAEFEFTNQEMVETPGSGMSAAGLEKKAAHEFMDRVARKCPECKITPQRFKWGNEFLVEYPDGWWFRISYDPGCVEIQTKPATHEELVGLKDRMETMIFGTAHDVGLTTDEDIGAGHMNFGAISTFGEDTNLFLDFAADFADHPQLAMGAWGFDTMNAPPMNYLKQYQRDAFTRILRDARDGKIPSVAEAARRIQKEVYTETTDPGDAGYHYQAMGLKKLNQGGFPAKDAPVEIRSFYPQKSAEDFIKDAEIISRRVQFLKEARQPLVYLNIRRKVMNDQEIVDSYYAYLEEMGMDWNRYKTTMRSDLQEIEPGEFVRGTITWSADYAASAEDFVQYVSISDWTRHRLLEAFTAPQARENDRAARVLMKLIDSTKEGSPTLDSQVRFITDVLNSPVWKTDPARNGIIRYLRSELPNVDFSALGPSPALQGPVKPRLPESPGACESELLGL